MTGRPTISYRTVAVLLTASLLGAALGVAAVFGWLDAVREECR